LAKNREYYYKEKLRLVAKLKEWSTTISEGTER
jgi:hypothetical protein